MPEKLQMTRQFQHFFPENFLEKRMVFLNEVEKKIVFPDAIDFLKKSEMGQKNSERKDALQIQGSLQFLQNGITKQQRLDIKRTENLHEIFSILIQKSGSNYEARKSIFTANESKIIEFVKTSTPPFSKFEQVALNNYTQYTGAFLQNIALKRWLKFEILESFIAQDKELLAKSSKQEKKYLQTGYKKKKRTEKNPEIYRPNIEISGDAENIISESRNYVETKITFKDGKRVEEKFKRDKEKNIGYVWGGTNLKKGVDCSGFIQALMKKQGIHIPRIANDQAKGGKEIRSKDDLIPGDLVFFLTDKKRKIPVTHVAIYVGIENGKQMMIHAASSKLGIIESELNSPYYKNKFVIGRRYLKKESK